MVRCAIHNAGLPYGYGLMAHGFDLDNLAGRAGEWGQVTHSKSVYRGSALTGDVTIPTGRQQTAAIGQNRLQDDRGKFFPAKYRPIIGR